MFPTRLAMITMENIMVTPISAESESTYIDIVLVISNLGKKVAVG